MKRILTIIFALSFACALLTGCSGVTNGYHGTSKYSLSDEDIKELFEKMQAIEQTLDAYYLEHTEYDKEDIKNNILKAYVGALGDPYTVYYTPEEYKTVYDSLSGEYYGIGVVVQQSLETGIITVVKTYPGYGAANAGIQKDDIITGVNGEDIAGKDVNSVVAVIKGEEHTFVDVTVYRPSTDEMITMSVERMLVKIPTVEYKMLNNNIGYVYIDSYEGLTAEQAIKGIDELAAQGMKGLVLDLRNNPGGLVDQANKICDRILDKDQLIVYLMDKSGYREDYKTTDPDTLDMPIVILVDGGTASASEIMTCCLQDYDKATVVGEKTFGKGIVQIYTDFDDGSGMKVTVAEYYSPDGNEIHKNGITPDIEAKDDPDTEIDEVLKTGMDHLLTEIQ